MNLKIATNISGIFNFAHHQVSIRRVLFSPKRFLAVAVFRSLLEFRNYDYLIFNGSGTELFLMGFYKLMFPFLRVKIVSLDLLLPLPETFPDRVKCLIRRVLLSKVHMFLLYYKNTTGIQLHYRIPPNRFRFIPFKINQYHKVTNAEVKDNGYVFCGGKTRRDFATLIQAVRGLSIPVRIVTMENCAIAEHGSYLNEDSLPENVRVIRLDGSFEPFLKEMAESRLAVLPLKPHICGTGIGVYIMAMALKKCVIISEDVSVDGVLNNDLAIIVPPNDPILLRDAINKAYYDAEYRKKFEINGYRYAVSLGGEERLNASITKVIIDDFCSKVH